MTTHKKSMVSIGIMHKGENRILYTGVRGKDGLTDLISKYFSNKRFAKFDEEDYRDLIEYLRMVGKNSEPDQEKLIRSEVKKIADAVDAYNPNGYAKLTYQRF